MAFEYNPNPKDGCGYNNTGFDHHQFSINLHLQNQNLNQLQFKSTNQNSMEVYFRKQSEEMDHYIKLQTDKFRIMLEQQIKQQYWLMVKRREAKASVLIREKDEIIGQANYKRMKLQKQVERIEMENLKWQLAAQEQEGVIVSLTNSLEQKKRVCCSLDDEESICDNGSEVKMGISCKGCNSGGSCVLFLPCRHLCSCKECEPFFASCPVCFTPKNASIEVLF